MSHGIRVWDANGVEIFTEEFYTFRVIDIIRVRGGTSRRPVTISAPSAAPGMTAFAIPVGRVFRPVGGRGFWTNQWRKQSSVLGNLPTITVGYGTLSFSSSVERLGNFPYSLDFDVVLVNT